MKPKTMTPAAARSLEGQKELGSIIQNDPSFQSDFIKALMNGTDITKDPRFANAIPSFDKIYGK